MGACTCAFLPSIRSRVNFPVGLIKGFLVFPRGFPTGLSHVPPSCESVLRVNVEAVQGKQVPLERTETSGGLLEWWNDPGVPLTFLVERASS